MHLITRAEKLDQIRELPSRRRQILIKIEDLVGGRNFHTSAKMKVAKLEITEMRFGNFYSGGNHFTSREIPYLIIVLAL